YSSASLPSLPCSRRRAPLLRKARSPFTAAHRTRRGARAWLSVSKRRPASRSLSRRRRPVSSSHRSRPKPTTPRATSGGRAAVTRGETAIGSTVLHGVINEIMRGFPVQPILPCEGVGYEVGSMAIIKGARNLDNAKKFFDWALTPEAQKIGLDIKEFAIPTN